MKAIENRGPGSHLNILGSHVLGPILGVLGARSHLDILRSRGPICGRHGFRVSLFRCVFYLSLDYKFKTFFCKKALSKWIIYFTTIPEIPSSNMN